MAGRGVAGGVRVEAARELVTAGQQPIAPGRIGANAGSGDTDPLWIELEATHRVDRGLAEDDFLGTLGTDPEVSQVLAGARGQLDLDADPACLTLDAADEKNRQGNSIPIRADLAADLRQWLA